MARTKASVGAKISSGKSSKARCNAAPTTSMGSSSGSSEKPSRSMGGGNPVCPRETPKWQRPITNFFINKHDDTKSDDDEETAGTSKPKSKRNAIVSSDEEHSPEKAKNRELDESIELETLSGDSSHKIVEYYPKGEKGKGVGKKSIEKEGSPYMNEKTEDNVVNGKNKRGSPDKPVGGKGKGVGKKGSIKKGNKKEDAKEKVDSSIIGDDKIEGEKGNAGSKEKNIDRCEKIEGKYVNGISESTIVGDDKTEGERGNAENNEGIKGNVECKENISDNIEKGGSEVDNIDEGSTKSKERSKREREDKLEEEGNISKKIKVK